MDGEKQRRPPTHVTTHRRGGLPRPPGVGERTTSVRPCEMVRGRCPRDRIRVEADVTVRTVENAVAGGHAERPQPVNRGRHATQGRARRRGGARNRRRLSTDGGAPGTVRPTTCGECFRIANTSSVIRRKGRRGRRPLRGVRVGMFLRSREVGGLSGYSFHARCAICRKAGFAAACRVHRPRCTMVT